MPRLVSTKTLGPVPAECFIGTVKKIGPAYVGDLKVGDKIATLVSLSLTPLKIDEIIEMRPAIDQVDIKGTGNPVPERYLR